MILRVFVLYGCLCGLAAVEPLLIQVPMDGSVLSLTVPEQGVILRADGPATATGRITFPPFLHDGLTATFFARSLRNVIADDWRQRPDIVGTRHDVLINFDSSLGTAAERARFGIGGSDGNWDNVSVQWDGFLRNRACATVDMHLLDRFNMARDRQRSCNISGSIVRVDRGHAPLSDGLA